MKEVPVSEYQSVPLARIVESPNNPRRITSKAADAELADSVKKMGVLEPLLVRLCTDATKEWLELIAGHRRLAAARAAGLAEVPVRILELSEDQALEAAIVENLQRQDVHPLDEAEGFARLIEHHKHTVPDVAARVGKSESYIYQRLALRGLAKKPRELFATDKLTAAHALLLARLQPKDQEAALEQATRYAYGEGTCTARQLAQTIEQHFHLDLHAAPWKMDDAELVPKAGSCATCPKRTGFTPALFADIAKKDTCTDRACFAEKRKAFLARREAELAAAGPVVKIADSYVYGQEQKKLEKAGALMPGTYHTAGSKKCPHVVDALVVAGEGIGHTKKICTSTRCSVHRPAASSRARDYGAAAETPAQKKKREEEKKGQALRLVVNVRAAVALLGKVKYPPQREVLRAAAEAVAEYAGDDMPEEVEAFFGLKSGAPFKLKTDLDVARILAWSAIANDCYLYARESAALPALCKSVGVDLKKLEKEERDRACRTCGCTLFKPCAGGCSWAEPDLCSACAKKKPATTPKPKKSKAA
jgi:ParB family chromosome partitioning protein